MKRLLLLPLLLVSATAATPPPRVEPTFLETLDVRVTNLDVVVTDRQGARVSGLRREDFEIRDDGKPQEVTNFTEYTASAGLATARGEEAAPPRRILFFVDEMSLHPGTRRKLKETVHTFVGSMRAGDEAMIVTPSATEKLALPATGDRAAIEAALDRVIEAQSFRTDTRAESERFFLRSVTAGVGAREAARPYAIRASRRITSTLRTLLGFVGGMAQLPGRKVVVMMTTSLTATPGHEAYGFRGTGDFRPISVQLAGADDLDHAIQAAGKRYWFDLRPMIRDVGAIAAANGVTIYTIQPDLPVRLGAPGRGADGSSGGAFALSPFERDLLEGTEQTLGALAEQTGGRFFEGEDLIDDALAQVGDDAAAYYSLGYATPPRANGSIRKVTVSVKGRPELTVRTRRELMDRSPSREMDEQTASTLFAPRAVNELGISATAAKPQRVNADEYKVDVAVKIPLASLTFIPAANDKVRATFSVHYAASDAADYTSGTVREETLQVPAAELAQVQTKNYTYTTTLVISPGTARVAVGVMDKLSRLSSFQRVTVEAK